VDGEIHCFEGFIIDTTDRRLAERELLKKKIRLEEKNKNKETK
jgi:hypothetical protein